ncbi:MAG: DUF2326 domain-containing protein [Candidatus Methanofastidiosia archaeon]|jgi:uncharacterized protein YydD (DUF2326 family)
MILKKFYSIPEKVNIEFKNGLNIICADISEKSTDKDSMNGAGKSTVLNLIDFCLLAEVDDRIKRSEEFQQFTFILECQDKNNYYKIKRSIKDPEKLYLTINNNDWEEMELEECKKLFKEIFFNIPEDEENELTFRTLMNCIKRDEKIGFNRIFYHHPRWRVYIRNAVNLFLIGLNYKLPLEKQELIKEKKKIGKIIYGLDKNLKRKNIPNKATLKSKKTLLERQIKNRQRILDNFKVHKEYHELEIEANSLTKQMKNDQNQLFVNNQKLEEYKEALSTYISIDLSEIEELYNSLEVNLSDSLIHRLSSIQEFHQRLIENRNTYLSDEIKRIESIQEKLRSNLELLDKKRASIMGILQTHGALSEYNMILQRLDEDKKERFGILRYIDVYEEISSYKKEKKKIVSDINENNTESENEINENEEIITQLIIIFEEIYENIVNVPGILVVGIKDTYRPPDQLFEFDVKGERKGSPGIERVRIFAYDLAIIFHNILEKRGFPRFVIHDGIFHGVDKRQILNATRYVIDKSNEESFQYITTMNTCDFLEGIDYEPYICVRLTDTVEGSLMGFKF